MMAIIRVGIIKYFKFNVNTKPQISTPRDFPKSEVQYFNTTNNKEYFSLILLIK